MPGVPGCTPPETDERRSVDVKDDDVVDGETSSAIPAHENDFLSRLVCIVCGCSAPQPVSRAGILFYFFRTYAHVNVLLCKCFLHTGTHRNTARGCDKTVTRLFKVNTASSMLSHARNEFPQLKATSTFRSPQQR